MSEELEIKQEENKEKQTIEVEGSGNSVNIKLNKPMTWLGCFFTAFLLSGCCAMFLALVGLFVAITVFLVKALWIFIQYLWGLF